MKNYIFILSLSLLGASTIYLLIKDYGFIDYQNYTKEYNNLNIKKNKKKQELQMLKQEIKSLNNNNSYIESILRENFFIKPDETIIIIK